jgi:hypothetical protein
MGVREVWLNNCKLRANTELAGQVINSFSDHDHGWNQGDTNVSLLALSGAALGAGSRSQGRFSVIPRKVLLASPTTSSSQDLSVGLQLQAFASMPADGQSQIDSVTPCR